ncbi:hypothetical protein [Paraburkholderia youngii]|uniref:hypothetical protein n=1 Tax=Paraburkholderia youngii TaxID=2782701 RepID=UPI003D1F5245
MIDLAKPTPSRKTPGWSTVTSPTAPPRKPATLIDLLDILMQDPPDLEDRPRRLLHAVPGNDRLLRLRAREMRAAIRNDAIVGIFERPAFAAPRDDRTEANVRADRQL